MSNGLDGWTAGVIRQITADPLYFIVNNNTIALSIASTGTATFNYDTSLQGNNYINSTKMLQWEGGSYWAFRSVTSATEFQLYQGSTGNTPIRVASDGKVTITCANHNQLIIQDSNAKLELGADDNIMIGIGMSTASDGLNWFTGRHRPGSSGIYDEMNVARLGSSAWVNLLRIYSNGQYAFTGSNISDIRLKENIEDADLDLCYNNFKQINLVKYKWKNNIYSNDQINDRSQLGWIAQDIEQIFPKSIITKNKFDIIDCKFLNSDQLFSTLYGTVQKLINNFENQENKINEFDTELNNIDEFLQNLEISS